jgi:hypothetical protein
VLLLLIWQLLSAPYICNFWAYQFRNQPLFFRIACVLYGRCIWLWGSSTEYTTQLDVESADCVTESASNKFIHVWILNSEGRWLYHSSNILTNPIEQCPSWETNNVPASQNVSCFLCHLKVHYRVHKRPSLDSLSVARWIQLTSSHLLQNPFQFYFQCMPVFSKFPILVRFSTKIFYAFLVFHACCMRRLCHRLYGNWVKGTIMKLPWYVWMKIVWRFFTQCNIATTRNIFACWC